MERPYINQNQFLFKIFTTWVARGVTGQETKDKQTDKEKYGDIDDNFES
jgi:hypothetical protein